MLISDGVNAEVLTRVQISAYGSEARINHPFAWLRLTLAKVVHSA